MAAIRIRRRLESETLHLPELRPLIGREVEIVVTEETTNVPGASEASAGESILEIAHRIAARIGPEALRKLPRDGAAQVDHYLYGTPKRED